MANKDIVIGGDTSFKLHYVDLGGGVYAQAFVPVDASGAVITGGAGGGGGAVTIADNADVAQGQKSDATADFSAPATLVTLLAAIWARLRGGQQLAAASLPVVLPATQITTLTPPAAITGFALDASLTTLNGKVPDKGQALAAASTPVVLTAAQITTLTPPAAITGFATAVKQPALGTAGTASTDVLTVQGIASGTAQPISAAALPLPAGAATESTLSTLSGKTLAPPAAPSANAVVAVLVTSTTVLAANASRRGLILQNLGTNPITVRLDGGVAVAGTGLILNPITTTGYGGGVLVMDSGVVSNAIITAITITATTNLFATEF